MSRNELIDSKNNNGVFNIWEDHLEEDELIG